MDTHEVEGAAHRCGNADPLCSELWVYRGTGGLRSPKQAALLLLFSCGALGWGTCTLPAPGPAAPQQDCPAPAGKLSSEAAGTWAAPSARSLLRWMQLSPAMPRKAHASTVPFPAPHTPFHRE